MPKWETADESDLRDLGYDVATPAPQKSYRDENNVNANADEQVPSLEQEYRALEFDSGAELTAFFDPQIRDGVVTLHPWQIEENERLAHAPADSQHPYKYALCAANGSGKDAFVIAPFVVWFALCNVQSLVVITSSSGVQLTAQTENYIKRLCGLVNSYFQTEIFRIRQRFITCRLSGSEIRMFATDEAGKAEGYHPIVPNGKMAIVINEAKSIEPDIIGALRRCTGFTHWVYVSTPGAPSGDFYKACTQWRNFRRVNYFDCPHLSADEYESDKRDLGEHSPLFRSKWLALFTSIGQNIIIPYELVNPLRENPPPASFAWWALRIGIDLAAGGDENAIQVWRGNTLIASYYFREVDTVLTASKISTWLSEQGIDKSHQYIFADDGGIGRAIIQMLQHEGWEINRVLNNSPSKRKKEYGNKGAENWFKVRRLIEMGFLRLDNVDEKCINQLCDRRFKQPQDNRLFLEPKSDARAEGRMSPDRADAMVLAFSDLSVNDFLEQDEQPSALPKGKRYLASSTSEEELEQAVENFEQRSIRLANKSNGNINILTKRQKHGYDYTRTNAYSRYL